MALETVTHISDLVATNPTSTDPKSEGDNHLRNIKTALLTDLPGITGPVTATQTELNILDGATLSTAELNILDGVTATTAEINYVDGVTSNIQTQLDAKQALDADLTALAGVSSAGLLARTGAGTAAARTLTAGAGIQITNGDGVSGDPTIAVTASAGLGDVTGPGSSTSGSIATFNGTTGKIIQDGGKALPSGSIVGTTDAQTLTNKTLTAPESTGAIYDNGSVRGNITAMGALDVDCSAGNYFTKTINGASTFTFSNAPSSRAYAFTLELTHTSGTVTWPAAVQWPGGTAPSLTTGKTHIFVFVTDDGGTRWRGASQVNYTN